MFGVKAKVNGPVQRPLELKAGLRCAFANRCRWWEPSRRDSKWKFPLTPSYPDVTEGEGRTRPTTAPCPSRELGITCINTGIDPSTLSSLFTHVPRPS